MQRVRLLILIKICLLLVALVLTGVLFFVHTPKTTDDTATTIILDTYTGMLVQDITTSSGTVITRLDAAKEIIHQLIQTSPQGAFGLITYGKKITYLIPPTTDSGIFLQYIDSILVSQNGNMETLKNGNMSEWDTGLVDSLRGKKIVVIGDVTLPQPLLSHAKNIGLGTKIHSINNLGTMIKNLNVSMSQCLNLSISQLINSIGSLFYSALGYL